MQLWNRAKDVAGQTFTDEISVIHGADKLFHQKPGIKVRLPKKDLWKTLLYNGVDPLIYTKDKQDS